MIKYFCDSCGKETIIERTNSFEVPCHLYSHKNKLSSGYTDGEGNSVSGRRDFIDLCDRCWNKAFIGALNAINMNP